MDDLLQPARDAIMAARRDASREIAGCPRPNSGCDAQFNHLPDLRARFDRALAEPERPERIPTSRNPD
jgi:hypothetical protein